MNGGPNDPARAAEDLVKVNPAALELAINVSIACRIEPELLRAMRHAMVASADASAEADLWLSALMRVRGPLYAVMGAEAANLLRSKLAGDQTRLQRARRVLEQVHKDAPPALKAEEEVIWRSLADANDPKIEDVFNSVLLAMRQGRSGLAQWAARALPNMPAPARESGGAWRVAVRAEQMLKRPVLSGRPVRALFSEVSSEIEVNANARTEIGIFWLEHGLRFSQPPEAGSKVLTLPVSNPLLMQIEWGESGSTRRSIVSLRPNSTETIAVDDASSIEITTASRARYRIELLKTNTGGLTARAYMGDGEVLLGFDLAPTQTDSFAGFAVQRTSGDTQEWLKNPLTQRGPGSAPAPSNEAPFQQFHWIDRLPPQTGGSLAYQVSAMRRSSDGVFEASGSLSLAVGPSSLRDDIRVRFTQPSPAAAAITGMKSSQPSSSRLRSPARILIDEFLKAGFSESTSSFHVATRGLDDPDIAAQFKELGARLGIVFFGVPPRGQLQYEDELRKARCRVLRHKTSPALHGITAVRAVDGRPVEALTGSASLSVKSLDECHNYIVRIREPRAVQQIFDEMTRLEADQKSRLDFARVEGAFDPGDALRILSDTSLDLLRSYMSEAKSSILFSLGETSWRSLGPVIKSAARSERRLLIRGSIDGRVKQMVLANMRTDVDGKAPTNAGNFIVLDFNQPHAMVITGIAGFSPRTPSTTAECPLEIRDPGIAAQFAVRALRMVNEFRWQFSAAGSRASLRLDPTEKWFRAYYEPDSGGYAERRAIVGATSTFDEQDTKKARPPAEEEGDYETPSIRKRTASKRNLSRKPIKKTKRKFAKRK